MEFRDRLRLKMLNVVKVLAVTSFFDSVLRLIKARLKSRTRRSIVI